jgi:SAM-dependent methyltransferase
MQSIAETDSFRLSEAEVRRVRESRRRPRPSQHDYLHARYLLRALERAFAELPAETRDILDVYCGTRPYDDLLPSNATSIGLDVTNFAGVADVVSDKFLPFEDESFDVVMCMEAFYYVDDPASAVAEIARVLRPGGRVLITVSLPWEYARDTVEHRYTGPELERLFSGFDEVRVVENGGYAVSWATLSGRIVFGIETRLPSVARTLVRPLVVAAYLAINAIGGALDWVERRTPPGSYILPMNLMLTAQRPAS